MPFLVLIYAIIYYLTFISTFIFTNNYGFDTYLSKYMVPFTKQYILTKANKLINSCYFLDQFNCHLVLLEAGQLYFCRFYCEYIWCCFLALCHNSGRYTFSVAIHGDIYQLHLFLCSFDPFFSIKYKLRSLLPSTFPFRWLI